MIIPALMHRTHNSFTFNASFLPLKEKTKLKPSQLQLSFFDNHKHSSTIQPSSLMGTENNLNDLRVASFSCYLKPVEGVVNMFDHNDQKLNDMAVLDLHKVKPSIFTARTPSAASEASGWSSNRGPLLQRKTPSVRRWTFHGCAGTPCSTRKDVYVPQKKEDIKFAFPEILTKEEHKPEELPRMSIEVFGSGTVNKGDIAKNLMRKMSILTWDAIPKSKESVICDDMASEASSDLFEIENISRTGWQPSESSCMSPSTQYAPSEASIEWSVVTASAADYSSVYSGYDEKQTVYSNGAKKSTRKVDNGLLGCKNFKSVKVVEPTTCRSKH